MTIRKGITIVGLVVALLTASIAVGIVTNYKEFDIELTTNMYGEESLWIESNEDAMTLKIFSIIVVTGQEVTDHQVSLSVHNGGYFHLVKDYGIVNTSRVYVLYNYGTHQGYKEVQ